MTELPRRTPLSLLAEADRCCEIAPDRMARILHALAHPARLHILRQVRASETPMVSLCRKLGLSYDKTMRHIVVLREAGLIGSGKNGGASRYGYVPQDCKAVAELVDLTLQFIDLPIAANKNDKR